MYDLPAFRQGQSSLHRLELAEVGDVDGKSLLHLQCHFGLDSLSWARLGARVTGVDFSKPAINYASQLSAGIRVPANRGRASHRAGRLSCRWPASGRSGRSDRTARSCVNGAGRPSGHAN